MIKHLSPAETCGDFELGRLLTLFPRVDSLTLDLYNQVSDDCLVELLHLPRIRRLELADDDRDLSRLRRVTDFHHLQEMKLDLCDRDPVPFPPFAWGGVTSLRRLSVHSDNPFDMVMDLPLLEHLESGYNSISASCLQHLVHLTSLYLHLPESLQLHGDESEAENQEIFRALTGLQNLQCLQMVAGPTKLSLMCIRSLTNLTCMEFRPEEVRRPVCPLMSLTKLCHLSKLQALCCEFVADGRYVTAHLASEQDGDVHWAVPWSPLRFSLKYWLETSMLS